MRFLKYALIGFAIIYSCDAYAGDFWKKTYENLKKAKSQVEKNVKTAGHEFKEGIEKEFLDKDEVISFRRIIGLVEIVNSDTGTYIKKLEKH